MDKKSAGNEGTVFLCLGSFPGNDGVCSLSLKKQKELPLHSSGL